LHPVVPLCHGHFPEKSTLCRLRSKKSLTLNLHDVAFILSGYKWLKFCSSKLVCFLGKYTPPPSYRGCPFFEIFFSKNSKKIFNFSKNFEKFRKKSKKILLHNCTFLTIVFGSKRPLLRYNMTIDYECEYFNE
jgi:hypothetical protein